MGTVLTVGTHIKDADVYNLPAGTEFYVLNGAWDGKILEEDGEKYLHIPEVDRKWKLIEGRSHALNIKITALTNEDGQREDLIGRMGRLTQRFKIKDARDNGAYGISVLISTGRDKFWTTLDRLHLE